MSATPDLIRQLHRSGVRLEARGDSLHVEALKGAVTPDLRALLINRKTDLLAALDASGARARLLAAVAAEYAELIHHLPGADLASSEGLPDSVLRGYVRALATDAERMAGRVPPGDTAAVHCARCGSVWLHPSVAAVLPVVNGWPRALGCPWCHVRKARGHIPRPPTTCKDCRHSVTNPTAGVSTCTSGHGTPCPTPSHGCDDFRPTKDTP